MTCSDMLWVLLLPQLYYECRNDSVFFLVHGNVAFYGVTSHGNELPRMNGIQPFVVDSETSRIATFNSTVFSCMSTDLYCNNTHVLSVVLNIRVVIHSFELCQSLHPSLTSTICLISSVHSPSSLPPSLPHSCSGFWGNWQPTKMQIQMKWVYISIYWGGGVRKLHPHWHFYYT